MTEQIQATALIAIFAYISLALLATSAAEVRSSSRIPAEGGSFQSQVLVVEPAEEFRAPMSQHAASFCFCCWFFFFVLRFSSTLLHVSARKLTVGLSLNPAESENTMEQPSA